MPPTLIHQKSADYPVLPQPLNPSIHAADNPVSVAIQIGHDTASNFPFGIPGFIPTPGIVASWQSTDGLRRAETFFSRAEFVGSPFPFPTLPATVFEPAWGQEPPRSINNKFSASEQLSHPEKVIAQAVVSSMASWYREAAQNCLPGTYAQAPDPPLKGAFALTSLAWRIYNFAQRSLPSRYSVEDLTRSPDKVIPAQVAAASVASWLQSLVQNALAQFKPQIQGSTAPDKVLPSSQVIPLSWLQDVLSKAQPQGFRQADALTHPEFVPLILLAAWFQEIQRIALSQTHQAGDALTHPEKSIAFPGASWFQEIQPKALAPKFQPGDTLTHPEKPLFVFVGWLIETAAAAVLAKHALGDVFTAPDKVIPFVPGLGPLAGWTPTIGRPKLPSPFLRGSDYTAPEKVLPFVQAVVTVAAWLANLAPNQIPPKYQQGPAGSGPEKPIPFLYPSWFQDTLTKSLAPRFQQGDVLTHPERVVSATAVILSWVQDVIRTLQPLHSQGPSSVAPEKVSAIVVNWLQDVLASAAVQSQHAQSPTSTAPDKTLPSLPSIVAWLANLPPQELPQIFASPEFTEPSKAIPFVPSLVTIMNWLQLLAPNAQPQAFAPSFVTMPPSVIIPSIGIAKAAGQVLPQVIGAGLVVRRIGM